MSGHTTAVLGRSGSGKGTQCALLCEMWREGGVAHRYIYAGETFRALLKETSPLGERIRAALGRGEFPSSDDATEILLRPLRDLADPASDIVLYDGSPRRLEEAQALDARLVAMGRDPVLAVLVDVSEEKCHDRLLARGREDDTEEMIRARLREFERNTVPVLDYYRAAGRLLTIGGEDEPQVVFQKLVSAFRAEDGVYE